MPPELAKAYDPQEAQQRLLQFWNERGYFHSRPDPARQPFTIVIPPPNVTGALHMGHALNNTLQDVLIRWRRMQGYNALWVPGTDHAGIATQAVVEREIQKAEKKTRHDLGREELVKRIWQWKEQYEARILRQLREIGASCDWQRTRFTMDPICARAVRETFFKMFKGGLIFQELTRPLLESFGNEWQSRAPLNLLDVYENPQKYESRGRRIVFLSNVIPTPATVGYEPLQSMIVTKVNGQDIKDMKTLIEAFKTPSAEGLHAIEFDEEKFHVYLDERVSDAVDKQLLERGLPKLSRAED